MRVICFDIDDTLYKEIDFVKSAYEEVACYAAERCYGYSDSMRILAHKAYQEMLGSYEKGGNAFEVLNRFLGLELPVSDYLTIYRQHRPQIALSDEVRETLDTLRKKGTHIGLITDGRSLQQRNKIAALSLSDFVDEADIVISEEFGSEKPSRTNYEYFMKRYPEYKDFVYVGDNPAKDFIAPNALGWMTVCLLDDGRNVHRQELEVAAEEARPQRVIRNIRELLNSEK